MQLPDGWSFGLAQLQARVYDFVMADRFEGAITVGFADDATDVCAVGRQVKGRAQFPDMDAEVRGVEG